MWVVVLNTGQLLALSGPLTIPLWPIQLEPSASFCKLQVTRQSPVTYIRYVDEDHPTPASPAEEEIELVPNEGIQIDGHSLRTCEVQPEQLFGKSLGADELQRLCGLTDAQLSAEVDPQVFQTFQQARVRLQPCWPELKGSSVCLEEAELSKDRLEHMSPGAPTRPLPLPATRRKEVRVSPSLTVERPSASESAGWEDLLYNDPSPIAPPERPVSCRHCLFTDNLPVKKRRRDSPSLWEGFDRLTVESSAAVKEVAFHADKELCRVCWSGKGGGVCWYEYEGVSRRLYEDMCSGAGFNGSIGKYLNRFKNQGHLCRRRSDLE